MEYFFFTLDCIFGRIGYFTYRELFLLNLMPFSNFNAIGSLSGWPCININMVESFGSGLK